MTDGLNHGVFEGCDCPTCVELRAVKPVDISERYAYIPDETGTEWRILDAELEWQEFHVPKKFASTPKLAVELLEYVTEKQQVAINSGYESGRRSMQFDLRKLLNLAPANGTQ